MPRYFTSYQINVSSRPLYCRSCDTAKHHTFHYELRPLVFEDLSTYYAECSLCGTRRPADPWMLGIGAVDSGDPGAR